MVHTLNPGQATQDVVSMICGKYGQAHLVLFASSDLTYFWLWFLERHQDSPVGQDALTHKCPTELQLHLSQCLSFQVTLTASSATLADIAVLPLLLFPFLREVPVWNNLLSQLVGHLQL